MFSDNTFADPPPLIDAVQRNDLDSVSQLLSSSSSSSTTDLESLLHAKDFEGMTALMWAADDGNVDIVKLLLSYHQGVSGGIDAVSSQGHTALSLAESGGHKEVVDMLHRYSLQK
eukprot:PhF_6_TR19438/c0_g1_i1/m.28432